MILHEHPHIHTTKLGDGLEIVAFGDSHWGARDCAEERLERMILQKYAENPNAYFLMMGDMLDAIVASDAKRYRPSVVSEIYAAREDTLDAALEDFARVWEKYKIPRHRLLGILSGNHHDQILKRYGTDLTERLAYRLKTKNLGYSAYIRILMRIYTRKMPVTIYAHHGFGGGSRTDGGSITKYCRHALRYSGANVYFYGHDHQRWVRRIAIVKPAWSVAHADDTSILVCGTGSFKRTVSHDQIPSYSEVAGYPPSELGGVCVKAVPTERKIDGKDRFVLDLYASE